MKSTNLLSRTCIAMVLTMLATTAIAQNQLIRTLKVSDGTVNQTQNPNALIDMQSTNKGLLLPRVTLTGTDDATTIGTHTEGMVVYNTVSAGSGGTAVSPGYYYNDGTQWVKIGSGGGAEVDGIIGNEVLNATTNGGLLRTGSGTAADPYTLGLTAGTTNGQVYKWNGTTWAPGTDAGITTEADGIIGNEVTNATTNGGLLRTGVGTAADPYTLGLTAGTANGQVYTWNGTTWAPATASNIYTADGTLTANRTVTLGGNALTFTGTTTGAFSVDGTTLSVDAANHRVGIGTSSPASTLEVNGSATNKTAYNAGTSTVINFANSNLAYTTASAGAFNLSGMKDGGTYTLAVQGATSGTSSFTHTGLTFKPVNNGATATSTHTLYTFVVIGTFAYYSMSTGL
jgi:hypothetical protein